ncbi:MAG: F0F1 ATP synthase subunit A, partial [Oscillospiraceae bacterium]|nr:F0F1 ATP synthase subunit A [Oscillospiraceae bacterium]
YFKRFVSPMFFMLPLLLLDEIIKPVSLALRLYGNVFGEESVTEQLYELLPIGAPIIMMVLSLLFCALQAVVFTMLTSIYLDEVTEVE